MKYAVNCSIMFTELPVLERAAAAKAAGFEAVEFWWPWGEAVPSDKEVDDFVASINDAGIQLIGLNFFAGNMGAGDRGLVSWMGREEEFRSNIPVVMTIAQRTGCKAFNALYGNRQPGQDPVEADQLALENLKLAAQAAEQVGGIVLVEPVSGSEAYPLKTCADVDRVVQSAHDQGSQNVKMLLDLYHLAANGDDLEAAVRHESATAGHCQIADFPGRGQPGTGELPLQKLLDQMKQDGYDGWVALEYKPTVPTMESFTDLPTLS